MHLWELVTIWKFHQFSFGEPMACDAIMKFCEKEWFCLRNVFIFSPVPAANVQVSGKESAGGPVLAFTLIQILLCCCWKPLTLLKMVSFLWRTFANIRQFHHRLWKKIKAYFTFQEYLVLLPKFHSALANTIPVFALSLTNLPMVPSVASALPNHPQSDLPYPHKLLSQWLFIFSSDLKLTGNDGKISVGVNGLWSKYWLFTVL